MQAVSKGTPFSIKQCAEAEASAPSSENLRRQKNSHPPHQFTIQGRPARVAFVELPSAPTSHFSANPQSTSRRRSSYFPQVLPLLRPVRDLTLHVVVEAQISNPLLFPQLPQQARALHDRC